MIHPHAKIRLHTIDSSSLCIEMFTNDTQMFMPDSHILAFSQPTCSHFLPSLLPLPSLSTCSLNVTQLKPLDIAIKSIYLTMISFRQDTQLIVRIYFHNWATSWVVFKGPSQTFSPYLLQQAWINIFKPFFSFCTSYSCNVNIEIQIM